MLERRRRKAVDSVWPVVLAIVPSIGVGFLLYKVLKAILEGDRNERLAHARWEASQSTNAAPATGWAAADDADVDAGPGHAPR